MEFKAFHGPKFPFSGLYHEHEVGVMTKKIDDFAIKLYTIFIQNWI